MTRINRYTTLPILLDLLERRKLVLLSPESWEDKNDSKVIMHYQEIHKGTKLFALCFSYGDETIHHWKTYANGISGCSIEFDEKKLIDIIRKDKNIKFGKVKYLRMRELANVQIDPEKIPFIKRWPYRCEEEFRIIWIGETKAKSIEIPIDLRIINKITINQGMPDQVYRTIKKSLAQVFANPDTRISRSTLFENYNWLAFMQSKQIKAIEAQPGAAPDATTGGKKPRRRVAVPSRRKRRKAV